MLKLGIVGHGFVGKAVDYGFSNKHVQKFIVDPNEGTTIQQLAEWMPNVVFICVPTPLDEHSGSVDTTILKSVMSDIFYHIHTSTLLVLKSTVTPDIAEDFAKLWPRFVYNPEFLTEKNANQDFINPPMQVFGSNNDGALMDIEDMYMRFSICRKAPVCRMSPGEASLVKYAVNSFLSVKLTFFNQLYDLFERVSTTMDFDEFVDVLKNDHRLGETHMQVPGPDGKRGFGGKCFPKDCNALWHFSCAQVAPMGLVYESLSYNEYIRPDVYDDGALSTGINKPVVHDSVME